MWPSFCLWFLQVLSFGKISLQHPLCSSLCLGVPCRMSFSGRIWDVGREAIFRVHKADLHGGLRVVAQHLVHFPRKYRKGWIVVICISDKIFSMWFTCIQGRWFGVFQGLELIWAGHWNVLSRWHHFPWPRCC